MDQAYRTRAAKNRSGIREKYEARDVDICAMDWYPSARDRPALSAARATSDIADGTSRGLYPLYKELDRRALTQIGGVVPVLQLAEIDRWPDRDRESGRLALGRGHAA